jgi:hypothetical protein
MGMWRTTMFAGALFVLLGGVAVADQPPPPGYWSFPGTALKNWCPQHLDDPKCHVTFVPAGAPAQDWCAASFHNLTDPENPAATRSQREAMEYFKGSLLYMCPQFRVGPQSWCSLNPAKCAAAIKTATPSSPTPVQVAPAPAQNWCSQAFAMLGAPGIDPFLKQALLEKARNRGCLQ